MGALKLPFRSSIFSEAPKKNGLIYFVGDSQTEAFELNEFLGNPNVRNRGIWGDKSDGILRRIDSIAILKPSKVFIMIGVNDVHDGARVEEVFENIKEVIAKIQTMSPYTIIYVQSVLPTDQTIFHSEEPSTHNIVRLNKMYQTLDNGKNILFINLYPHFLANGTLKKELSFDNVHLTGKGYALWAKLLKPYL